MFDWPKSIAIAMVTGQSGKVAAVVPQKLHSVAGYIVCFSNIRGLHLIQWVHLDVQLFREEISIPELNTAKP